jgi:hypothetical protein
LKEKKSPLIKRKIKKFSQNKPKSFTEGPSQKGGFFIIGSSLERRGKRADKYFKMGSDFYTFFVFYLVSRLLMLIGA